MNKELANKLIEDFKNTNATTPEFAQQYRALAFSMSKPIFDILNSSEVRQNCKRILLGIGGSCTLVKPCLTVVDTAGKCELIPETKKEMVKLPIFNLPAEMRKDLKTLSPEDIGEVVQSIAKALIDYETILYNGIRKILDDGQVVLVVKSEYHCFDDPTILKQQKVGFYGWESIGMFNCLNDTYYKIDEGVHPVAE